MPESAQLTSAYAGGRRLEATILHALTGKRVDLTRASRDRLETSGGWRWGKAEDYDPAFAVDPFQLWAFLSSTQITTDWDRAILDVTPDSPTYEPFLTALRGEIAYRGIVDVLRRGVSYGPLHLNLYYGLSAFSTPGTRRLFRTNRFTVTPRVRYSAHDESRQLSLCLFLNGLPLATIALADGSEMTSTNDAIDWYRRINVDEEPLFQPGRCLAHFAVDDVDVAMCADLHEMSSDFFPFNRGVSDDEENPASLFGVATDYLWRRILTRRSVADIIENYAQVVASPDETTGRNRLAGVFPRYHQLDAIRRILADVDYYGVGRRYLIQHGAGSGKAQSLVWLVSQLIDLELVEMAVFGTVVVVTDRPISDTWLAEHIRQFAQTRAIVDARISGEEAIEEYMHSPDRIILVHPRAFPLILHEIKDHFHGYGYALVIEEGCKPGNPDDSPEESVETIVNRAMQERGFLPNASYFVFSATPNDTTLELFGHPINDYGVTRYRPFHRHGA